MVMVFSVCGMPACADKPCWVCVVSATRRSSGVAPRACCVRVVYARPPNFYIHTHTYIYNYMQCQYSLFLLLHTTLQYVLHCRSARRPAAHSPQRNTQLHECMAGESRQAAQCSAYSSGTSLPRKTDDRTRTRRHCHCRGDL